MDQTLRQNITDELTIYLNRPPSEDEIVNGQTDLYIMGKIRDKEIAQKDVQIANLTQQIADVQESILTNNVIIK